MRTKNTDTLPNEKNSDAVKEICTLIAGISDEKLIYDFFGCLFTSAELKDFANRWHLVKELDAGTTQREIAKKYNMSLCNITRGSRELKKENSAFRRVLEILKETTGQ
ncbi:MAG: trp operon repressor [Treponema sp.]|nr:trp operon repressor [Treponema sp.]